MQRVLLVTLAAITVAVAASMSALAGPPLICHEFKTGGADSISWGSRAYDIPRGVSIDALTDETIAVLDKSPHTLARMETIRRAVLITGKKEDRGEYILSRFMARALDAQAAGENEADAWFDVAFLAQSLDQNYSKVSKGYGESDDIVGYAWMRHALALDPEDSQKEFAAALMTVLYNEELAANHLSKARAGATTDRLLAINIENFSDDMGHRLDHHRRNYASGH